MGQGYVRNDTANNIADGNVADAADIDGEFDAIVAAFEAATGHTHDGTAAEGGAITVVGPAQEYVGAASDFSPKADSLYDLGKTAVRWATGYIDDLNITTNITVGGTVDGRDVATDGTKLDNIELSATADQTGAEIKVAYESEANTNAFTDALLSKLNAIEALADVTDVTNVTAAGALMDSEVDVDIKTLSLPANTTISTFGATLIDDADAAAALTTLGAIGATTTVTLTNKTITDVVLEGSVTEEVFAVTGTTPVLNPANGTIQTWTLSANSTPTLSFDAGESLTLMIDDGTSRTITWPTITWLNNGGSAPTLVSSGYTVVVLWKVSTVTYGVVAGGV
jgi:hypothetical protein